MRYTLTENTTLLGRFTTGDTVTISLYDLSDDSVVALDSNSCSEIGSTGIFKWNSGNITTPSQEFVEYLWIMDNGSVKQYGKLVLGGYPDEVSEMHKLQGLKSGSPMTVTPTSREVGDISLAITGDGKTTSTVTRQ